MLLSACQPASKSQLPVVQTPVQKHAHAQRYAVDATRSTILLHVYRDGPLARFGHNHVIAVTQLQGTVFREPDILQSDVELSFPVTALSVDVPADRTAAGADFPGALPLEAIAGTRQHMLGPQLLAAEQYPQIALRTVAVSGQWPELQLLVEIQLRKFVSRLVLPVHMTEVGNALIADGTTKLSQVQLGLTPYSVLGGGLRVNDSIDVQFHIVAARAAQEQ
jgi:polyisoprenoid-binding protein YceI